VAVARNVVPDPIRGLRPGGRGRPASSILEIDWRRNTLVDLFSFATDRHVGVHGFICES
jgi:hypothetical protein